MDSKIEILDGAASVLLSTGITIKLREMTWRETLSFVQKLSDSFSDFINQDGKFVLNSLAISRAVVSASSLSAHLLEHSAGFKLEDIDKLRPADALALIDKAIELNITEELFARGKALAARVSSVMSSGKKA